MPKRDKTEVVCPECGSIFDASTLPTALPRSPKQHKAFFQMVRIATDSWPHNHPSFQPIGATRKQREEHMRAWLLVQANHKRTIGEPVRRQDLMDWDIVKRIAAAAMQPNAMYPYRFPDERNGALVIDVPKSIAESEVPHTEFQGIFDEVMFVVQRETGLEVKFIKQELRRFV
jgi:hypothetical protein